MLGFYKSFTAVIWLGIGKRGYIAEFDLVNHSGDVYTRVGDLL
jgi:hypothetical protein